MSITLDFALCTDIVVILISMNSSRHSVHVLQIFLQKKIRIFKNRICVNVTSVRAYAEE